VKEKLSLIVGNMKKLILVFYAITLWESAFSQQERQVSHYMFDHISINPGSAGSGDMISTNVIYRQQWPGMDGAPTNFIGNLSAPFKIGTTHHGVGLAIWSDQIGFNKDIDASVSYAYQFSVGNGTLGLGISGSFINREVKGDWRPHETDPDFIPESEQSKFAFDLAGGLFYRTDELYVGISSTRILENGYDFKTSDPNMISKDKLVRHYYLTAGYNLQLSNPLYEFKPSIFLQTVGSITKVDINATLMYNKKFWGGVSYRVGSAVVGMVGLSIMNGVRIGYSYDFDTSKLSTVSKGGHEILVGYDFKLGVEKLPQKYRSIRYL
jgi:type IX secretion system PorP/SprF family membrane protein